MPYVAAQRANELADPLDDLGMRILRALAWVPRIVVGAIALTGRLIALRLEIRRTWPNGGRVIILPEGPTWAALVQERWLPAAKDSTILLAPIAESTSPGDRLCLAWRVYLMHGPMFPFSPPPVAVVVRRNGTVRRVDFASAIQLASHGDQSLLDARFAELTRYAARAGIRMDQ